MSYRIKDPDTGEFITIANGSRMFVGTTAAIDAAIARGELKYPDLYACTDDYPTGDDDFLEDASADGGDTYITAWTTRRSIDLTKGVWVVTAYWKDGFNTGGAYTIHRLLNATDNTEIARGAMSAAHSDSVSAISGEHHAGTLSTILSVSSAMTVAFQNTASVGGGATTNVLRAVRVR